MNSNSYDVTVSYDAGRISLIDRNITRVALSCRGSLCGTYFDTGSFRIVRRQFTYRFDTKLKRLRFIQAMRRFIKDSDFGVRVRVGEVEHD